MSHYSESRPIFRDVCRRFANRYDQEIDKTICERRLTNLNI